MFFPLCFVQVFPMANHFLFLFLLPYVLSVATGNELLIKTKNGQVQGKLLSTKDGQVRAFLGIPYAKPPVEKLRFRAPQPAQPWRGVKDATKYGNSCYQLPDSTFPGRTRVYKETVLVVLYSVQVYIIHACT